eukprot:comp22168_c0_seq3/m.32528 comp22168_c0_seq3/g.32528  ORF comp22168_c0_seq3/g.32528 comp22168_c0_seq3/m.32528 type:complete len:282 (-) comp22168_c0_seq3:750-1595(-)
MSSAVTDIILVKGERCPAGYILLSSSPAGHNVSLTRGSFKSDVYICVKKEDFSVAKVVITDLTVIMMGKEKVPQGFVLIESKAGGKEVMVYVKKEKKEEAIQYVSDVICCIPAKKDYKPDYKVVESKPIGNEGVCIAYQLTPTGLSPPAQSSRPSSVSSTTSLPATPQMQDQQQQGAAGMYPKFGEDGRPMGPQVVPYAQSGAQAQADYWAGPTQEPGDHVSYVGLRKVPVEIVSKGSLGGQETRPIQVQFQIQPKTRSEIDHQYNYDFSLERSVMQQIHG